MRKECEIRWRAERIEPQENRLMRWLKRKRGLLFSRLTYSSASFPSAQTIIEHAIMNSVWCLPSLSHITELLGYQEPTREEIELPRQGKFDRAVKVVKRGSMGVELLAVWRTALVGNEIVLTIYSPEERRFHPTCYADTCHTPHSLFFGLLSPTAFGAALIPFYSYLHSLD